METSPLTPSSTSPRARLFRGWLVVAGAFAVTLVGFGSAYTFSAFLESLQRDFGASRGSVSLVFSLAGFLYFGLGVQSRGQVDGIEPEAVWLVCPSCAYGFVGCEAA